jgi:hypothetical protein
MADDIILLLQNSFILLQQIYKEDATRPALHRWFHKTTKSRAEEVCGS